MFEVKCDQVGVIQLCQDGDAVTVQRYDLCAELSECEEAVQRTVAALEAALLEVVRQSWRYHFRRRVLDATNGLHA